MLSSMTGFGRAIFNRPAGKLIVEIQSVNRKYFEIFVSIPREFSRFEHEVRSWVSGAISRGQITARIYWLPSLSAASLPDVKWLKQLKREWERVARQLGYDPKKIDLSFLVHHLPDLSTTQWADEKERPVLRRCVGEALQGLLQMKQKEGKALQREMRERCAALEKMLGRVEKLAPEASRKMKERLKEKIEEALAPSREMDERLLREVALFAEKVDISEEINRLKSHFTQFQELLTAQEMVGRKIDFLVQEMGREVHTIGSKSAEVAISHLVVEMKSELEKMREQIQNIE